ncbi:hypothetical protein HWV62_39391 [Athelia sp. TMB]|nr:hypothetical protein HWV62_39391 [Athelia sp. TMB]
MQEPSHPAASGVPGDTHPSPRQDPEEPEAEAARAYSAAIATLSTLLRAREPEPAAPAPDSAILTSLTAFQGEGPVGSAVRIGVKLYRKLLENIGGAGSTGRRKPTGEGRRKAVKITDLLQHAAELGSEEALYKLAHISLFPPTFHFPSAPALAYASFSQHAERTGNASSQAFLAFFHATGYRGVTPVDQAQAQLFYTFAAHGGDSGAQMALAYRFWAGVGAGEDCGRAVGWYEQAAHQAMERFYAGPPLGRRLPLTPTRLSDLEGGVYGPGASVASTGMNVLRPAIKAGEARAVGETWEDVLEYYSFNADRGETDFSYRLGKIFYSGSIYPAPGGIASGGEGVGRVPRDLAQARHYFLRIARTVWPRDPPPPHSPLTHALHAPRDEAYVAGKDGRAKGVGYAGAAAGYLGRMYLRGEGVRADPAVARMWFERGAETGDRESHNALGVIWRDGLVGGQVNEQKALAHLQAAAREELAEAQVNLGKWHYERGDLRKATAYFETAVRQGSPFEAYYYLALLQSAPGAPASSSALSTGSCAVAVSFYKLVAERGVWGDDLLLEADAAWAYGTDRSREMALLKWWLAAERGSEVAQNNLAFVLDQDKSILRLTRFSPTVPSNDTARLALTQWTRSAAQRNVDALVKVGDYHYHGLGVSGEAAASGAHFATAARYYQAAADTQLSALAMWNLGWMYENGVGVPQDYHLAKRHYDMALETNSEAYLPVLLSLIKLHARSFWHTLKGGKNGLDLWDFEDDHARTAAAARELDGGHAHGQDSAEAAPAGEPGLPASEHVEDDGPWYMGKAKEEYTRRRGQDAPPRDDEDHVEWARERRNAEQERDSDLGPEDYFEGALRGGHRGEYEGHDEFGETMLLVALCLAVSVLLYVRTRLVERVRRETEGNGANNNNNGDGQQQPAAAAFPPGPDPNWGML